MKKSIYILILLLICKIYASPNDTNILRIFFIDYDILTTFPLSGNEVVNNGNCKDVYINYKKKKEIERLLKEKEEVNERIMPELSIDYSFLNGINEIDLENNQKKTYNDFEYSQINDLSLNVRYVLELSSVKKKTIIYIGQSQNLVRIDNSYYKIPKKNFLKLLNLVRKYIDE